MWRVQISAEGEIVMRGSFAFVFFESSCWYKTRGKSFGVDENYNEMRDRKVQTANNQEFMVGILGQIVG